MLLTPLFLSIHTPGEEIGKIRRFLDLKKATLISALDEDRGNTTIPPTA